MGVSGTGVKQVSVGQAVGVGCSGRRACPSKTTERARSQTTPTVATGPSAATHRNARAAILGLCLNLCNIPGPGLDPRPLAHVLERLYDCRDAHAGADALRRQAVLAARAPQLLRDGHH